MWSPSMLLKSIKKSQPHYLDGEGFFLRILF